MAVAAGLGMMLASLDFSVNVALPAMRDAFDADLAAVQWVIVVFIATRAGLALGAGAFADRFGLRSVYIFGAAAYVVAMVCLALSPSLAVMVGFRVVQAVGTGCLYSAAPAIAAAVFPERRRGLSMGFTSASLALGMVTSTLAAGPLVAAFDWPAIYAGRIPLAVPALIIGALVAPGRRPPPAPAAANTATSTAESGSPVAAVPASSTTSEDANANPATPPIPASSTISGDANGSPVTPTAPALDTTPDNAGNPAMPPVLASSTISAAGSSPPAPPFVTISEDANGSPAAPAPALDTTLDNAGNLATPPVPASAFTSDVANANPTTPTVPASAITSDDADGNPATSPVPASPTTSDNAGNPTTPAATASVSAYNDANANPAAPGIPASGITSNEADSSPAAPAVPAFVTISEDADGSPATPAVPASAITSDEADSSPAAPAVPTFVAISEDAAGSSAAPAVPASGITSDNAGGSPAPAVSTSAGTGGGADGEADAGRAVSAGAPAEAGGTSAAGQEGQTGQAGRGRRGGEAGAAGRFDLAGAVLVLSVMVCLMIGLRLGQAIGWGAAPVVALLTAAPALLVVLIRVERRAAAPVLPGALLRLPGFQTAVAAMFLGHFSQFAIWFIFPFYITDALGRGPVTLGIMLAAMSSCNILSAPAGGWLCDRWSVRPVGSIGLGLTAVGLLAMSLLDGGSAIWHPAAGIAVVGLGVGWFQSAAYALMLGSVPAARFGTASGAMSLAQASGTVFCVSVVGAIFAALSDYYAGAGGGVGVGDAFLLAYRDVFRIGAGTAALSTIAFALRARQPGGQRG